MIIVSSDAPGFRIAQARLGPGCIHRHCVRTIGMAERAFEIM
jgi:acyl-CoA dehydrogenase